MDDERFAVFQRFFQALKVWSQQQANESANSADTTARRVPVSSTADTQEATIITSDQGTQSRMAKPEQWLLTLRPQDLEILGMPAHTTAIQLLRSWSTISRRERRNEIKHAAEQSQAQALADFADMLAYWQEAELILEDCNREGRDLARISYAILNYPFQGKNALEEMLMFFGFFSIVEDSC
ncbi:MAG: hypothetical protein KC496_19255 [Anaerolineae bacterium]|nr:hypothetical protein [Anaerolineae bacterium]